MLVTILENTWENFGGQIVVEIMKTKKDRKKRIYILSRGSNCSEIKADFFKLVFIAEKRGGSAFLSSGARSLALKLWAQTTNPYQTVGYNNVIF